MTSWPLVQLAAVVCRPSTWNPATTTPAGSFVYVDLSAVNQETKEIVGARHIAGKDAPSRARQLIAAGDVLVSTVRPNLNSVARVQPELDGATASTGFCVLRPRDGLLDPDYLFHWVRTSQFAASMTERASGASYPAVSDGIVLDSSIPLPPLEEQRRIAEVLDSAEAVRAKRRAELVLLDTLTESIFLEMFGNPLGTSKGRLVVAFKDAVRRITYGFTCPMKHLEKGIPIVTAKNVQEGRIDFSNVHFADEREFTVLTSKAKPQRGDILITKDGSIGRCAVVETVFPFCINQSVALVQPSKDRVLPGYMAAYLSTAGVQRVLKGMSKGNALAHLQISELAGLPMPLPPRNAQEDFVRRTTSVKATKRDCERSMRELTALFSSLQHRAFRGEL